MGDALRAGQAALFQNTRFSDMVIRFKLEEETVQPKKKQRTDAAQEEPGKAPIAFLGEPLPAHRSILCLSSGFISTRLESWQSAVEDGAQGGGSTPSNSGRPEVLVTLGSEAELPHALEVIRFMYTGQLTEGLGFEALLHVRHLAGYLEVADCLRACDAELLAWVDGSGPCSSGSSGSSGDNGCNSRVLQAYRHHALFPDPETAVEPASFTPVLQALGGRLVQHLKDAVSVYTDPQLLQQWCALPACAVEAVLAADDFPTDSESTVLLLLGCWRMKHQSPPADPATTERLCRLIRASRLSPTYASLVLPHLDWFPATKSELALIQLLVNAPDEEHREHLQPQAKMLHPVWAKAPKRKQLVAPEGRAVEWRVARSVLDQRLKDAAQRQQPHKSVLLLLQLNGPGVLPGGKRLLSCGLLWSCGLAAAYSGGPESPTLQSPRVFCAVASMPAEVSVPFTCALTCNLSGSLHKRSDGRRLVAGPWSVRSHRQQRVAWASSTSVESHMQDAFMFVATLPDVTARAGNPPEVLADYLHDGELVGSITIQPAS